MTWIFDGHTAAPTRNTEPGLLLFLKAEVPLSGLEQSQNVQTALVSRKSDRRITFMNLTIDVFNTLDKIKEGNPFRRDYRLTTKGKHLLISI